MSLLSIVQDHCRRSGLQIPPSVQSSTDPQVIQMIGLVQEFCDDMVTRKAWSKNTRETLFTSVGGEDQGALETLSPFGFEEILFESIFDRTQRLPLLGGLNAAEWQARKALDFTGPLYNFRIVGGRLLFNPALPAGHQIAYEYYSSFFAQGNDDSGTVYRQYLLKDADECTLGDRLPKAYLRWAWKKEKGFDYAEDFLAYERLVSTASNRDARPQAVSMSDRNCGLQPGIFVPYGSWPVTGP